MYKTFKQYLLEASNLSNGDKETILNLISSCYTKDRNDINSWLFNTVYKWIINKSNHTNSDFFTKEEIINVKGEKDIRDVFKDVNGRLQNRIINVVEYLYNTYTIEQASIKYGNNLVRLSFVDAEKEFKQAALNIKEVEGIDYKVVKKYSDGYKMISLLSVVSLTREGKCVGHCTKDKPEQYITGIQKGDLEVISLRDNYNRPHATLQHNPRKHSIVQIKGNGNGPVVRQYIPYIMEYLKDNNFKEIEDLQNINAIKLNDNVYDLDHIPTNLVINTPIVLGGEFFTTSKFSKPPQFPDKVNNDFICINIKLTELTGSPQHINGNFSCSYTDITTLKGGPQYVKHSFTCNGNDNLISLEDAPTYVGEDFDCHGNKKLESLVTCPSVIYGDFDCSHNNLITLKGSPNEIYGNFDCSYNKQLTSLEDCPKLVGRSFICKNVGKKFTEEEIRKVCNIQGKVYV